jgi:hypothetical protein
VPELPLCAQRGHRRPPPTPSVVKRPGEWASGLCLRSEGSRHWAGGAAQVIRSLLTPKKYVIVVEHDLSVLDYLSDYICCLYGKPGAYGVVTMPFSVREGINIFLAGFVPTENLRFREESLSFKARENPRERKKDRKQR